MRLSKKVISRQVVAGRPEAGLTLKYEVVEAHPVKAILEGAEKASSGLIVMGTHGRGGLTSLLLGSVVENVVRNAKIPVFTVRQKEHEFIDTNLASSAPRLKRILCPVNMTEGARGAMTAAVSLAQRFQSHLTVLYALETEEPGDLSKAGEELQAWISSAVNTQPDWKRVVRPGHAADQIITTELVLRHSPVPVRVIPHFTSKKDHCCSKSVIA
jgi:Universal stress protein family